MKFQGKTYRVQFDFSNRDLDDLDVDVTIQVQDESGSGFKTLATGIFVRPISRRNCTSALNTTANATSKKHVGSTTNPTTRRFEP